MKSDDRWMRCNAAKKRILCPGHFSNTADVIADHEQGGIIAFVGLPVITADETFHRNPALMIN